MSFFDSRKYNLFVSYSACNTTASSANHLDKQRIVVPLVAMNARSLFYALSPKFRFLVRRIYYFPVDLFMTLSGKRHPLQPPKGMIYTGSGDFIQQGQRHLQYLIRYAGLLPEHHILDVGSGIGRTAVALTSYLSNSGTYHGFDVVQSGVSWCIKHITAQFPNFNFTYVPLKNDLYTSEGQPANHFIFPYADNSFDRCVLMSVFTHMSVDEIAHYISEIFRCLKPGGICMATFFVFDEDTLLRMKNGETDMQFQSDHGHYWLMNDQVIAANICIEQAYLHQLLTASGFCVDRQVNGYWRDFSKQQVEIDYQDIMVFRKPVDVS
jgi:SAM-dependent methyltransferase